MKRKKIVLSSFATYNFSLLFVSSFLFQRHDDGEGILACAGCGGSLFFIILVFIAFIGLPIACWWVIFTKAGKPGWAAIIPIYNVIILTEIVGRETYWAILAYIPFVNIVALWILLFDLAKSFGKEPSFGIGMLFLPFIFYPMLAFGSATYIGPSYKKEGTNL